MSTVTDLAVAPDAPPAKPTIVADQQQHPSEYAHLRLYEMVVTPLEAEQGAARLREIACAVLRKEDIVPIGQRPFIRKSGWQRLATIFGVRTTIATCDRIGGDGPGAAWRVTIRATKGPCLVERAGLCTLAERKATGKPEQLEGIAMAMAETRAAGRAISALFGLGDISAEEAGSVKAEDVGKIVSPLAEAVNAAHAEAAGMRTDDDPPPPRAREKPAERTPDGSPRGPSEAQMARLKQLGCPISPATRFEAAALIGELEKKAAADKADKKSTKSTKSIKSPASPKSHSPASPPAGRPEPSDAPKQGAKERPPAPSDRQTDKEESTSGKAPQEAPTRAPQGGMDDGKKGRSVAPSSPPAAGAQAGHPPEGKPEKGATDSRKSAGPAAADSADAGGDAGETSTPDPNARSPSDDACICPPEKVRPSPPLHDWDSTTAVWTCSACGDAIMGGPANTAIARLRGLFAGRMQSGLTVQQSEAELGYARPPYAVDINKPPTPGQIERLAGVLGRTPDPSSIPSQIHAWAMLCALGTGRA